jgi:hypothetical protein
VGAQALLFPELGVEQVVEIEREIAPPPAPVEYIFEGDLIRISAKDLQKFKSAYPHIDNFEAVFFAFDNYHSHNPKMTGKYWHALIKWIDRENLAAGKRKEKASYGTEWW